MESAISALSALSAARAALDFSIDGAVLKLEDLNLSHALGATHHHPKGALAFKFAAKATSTVLQSVQWAVGRTPKLTPVALLQPVQLDGVTVKRANLHNASVLQALHPLRIGDRVRIERRGDVIPYVVGKAEDEELPGADSATATAADGEDASVLEHAGELVTLPTHCPCPKRAPLVQRASATDPTRFDLCCSFGEHAAMEEAEEAGAAEEAENSEVMAGSTSAVSASAGETCPGQAAMAMEYYASKAVLDIGGLGEATIALLREHGFLASVADIVRLPSQRGAELR